MNCCEKCGMHLREEERRVRGFCVTCGDQRTQRRRYCPNRVGWFDGHYDSRWRPVYHLACEEERGDQW